MARLDVHETRDQILVVVCQSSLFDHLSVRLVMPLIPADSAPAPASRLNPLIDFEGQSYLAFPQWASGVPLADLGPRLGNLEADELRLIGAVDLLLTGV